MFPPFKAKALISHSLRMSPQARKSWEDVNIDKKKVFMNVSDGSASNNLSVIPCIGCISEDQQKKALFPLESDLVVLRLAVNDGRGKGFYFLFSSEFMNSAYVLWVLHCKLFSRLSTPHVQTHFCSRLLNKVLKNTIAF